MTEGQAKSSLKVPLLVMAVALVMLVLAWVPGQGVPVQQRPYVDLHIRYDRVDPRLEQLASDLQYRMNTHHAYRLLSESTVVAEGYRVQAVEIELRREGTMIFLKAVADGQALEVQGPASAASSLSGKLFSLINQTLEQA